MAPMVRDFKSEDLDGFVGREGDGAEEVKIFRERLKFYEGIGWSAILGERVIGCAGMVKIGRSLGYPWAIFRREIEEYPLWLHRTVSRCLLRAMNEMNLTAAEVDIEERKEVNRQWAERLGFELVIPIKRMKEREKVYVKYRLEALCLS